jgi:hypothetical protein
MLNATKPTKKSGRGKKNWRKNIDVSKEEKVNVAKAQDNFANKNISHLKNEALFSLDKGRNII